MTLQNQCITPRPYVIVYDSTCRFCSHLKDWILKRAGSNALEAIGNQDHTLIERYAQLSMVDLQSQMVVILPSGQLSVGAEAAYHITTQLPFYKNFAFCYWIPGLHLFCNLLYKWITKNRHNWRRNCDGCNKTN